ncbi:pentapeptide repeat-containing protein [Salinibaculum rarum]|uniref:pentapeptide repeat-containing protein n=1 Tax=Salinibaculum rarum TaxID=3058903 RepID=UPI00265FE510|nr:pentapeptide repeat-containing protein [Salinibaculum sp. KK48]
MTRAGGTCSHSIPVDGDTYRASDFPAESLDDGVWHCPHDADGEEKCIFHRPSEQTDDATVVEAFAAAVDDTDGDGPLARRRRREFVGAQFGTFEWPDRLEGVLDGVDGPLYLSHADFAGTVSFADATIEHDLRFNGATFEDGADFSGVVVRADVRFGGVTFRDDVTFDRSTFEMEVRAGGISFEGEADFYRATFLADLNLKYATFEGPATFWKATIAAVVRFNGATFCTLDDDWHALQELDLTNANFTDATLRDVNLEASELGKAKLFGTDLRGTRLHGTVLTDARIDDRTQFLGVPDASPFSVRSLFRFWDTRRCVYDPRYGGQPVGDGEADMRTRAKSTYRTIETVARSASRPELQSVCFVNRQDIHRRTHRDNLFGPLPGTDTSDGPQRANIAGLGTRFVYRSLKLFQWLRSELSRWTLLYGESPWRVIATGVTIVLAFALLYPLGGLQPIRGAPVTYGAILDQPSLLLDSIYFSTLTFTTLGMGDFQPVGVARLLMTLQTSIGAILIALLVFVFGRRAVR